MRYESIMANLLWRWLDQAQSGGGECETGRATVINEQRVERESREVQGVGSGLRGEAWAGPGHPGGGIPPGSPRADAHSFAGIERKVQSPCRSLTCS